MNLNGVIKTTGNGIYFTIVIKIQEYGFLKNLSGADGP